MKKLFLASWILLSQSAFALEFYTTMGLEPDKWASIWLIKTHISQDSTINFVDDLTQIPSSAVSEEFVSFDISGAQIVRTANNSLFYNLINKYAVPKHNNDVQIISEVIHDLEINTWEENKNQLTDLVEVAFRQLQFQYENREVPFSCYMGFFNNLSDKIRDTAIKAITLQDLRYDCNSGYRIEPDQVNELHYRQILSAIAEGKNVVFIDTRQIEEFREASIPGAIRMSLTQAKRSSVDSLMEADLIIPYCVKDFRAYEVAKALNDRGLERVAIMNPYGLKGWIELGLPIKKQHQDLKESVSQLKSCSQNVARCVSK